MDRCIRSVFDEESGDKEPLRGLPLGLRSQHIWTDSVPPDGMPALPSILERFSSVFIASDIRAQNRQKQAVKQRWV